MSPVSEQEVYKAMSYQPSNLLPIKLLGNVSTSVPLHGQMEYNGTVYINQFATGGARGFYFGYGSEAFDNTTSNKKYYIPIGHYLYYKALGTGSGDIYITANYSSDGVDGATYNDKGRLDHRVASLQAVYEKDTNLSSSTHGDQFILTGWGDT